MADVTTKISTDEAEGRAPEAAAGTGPVELTVIAPCYNESFNVETLTGRLLRVFRRHGIRGEVILVNDASTDDTGAKIDALAAGGDNVTAIHHPRNRGLTAGWDSGLAAAGGQYVCFIDADLQNTPEEVWRLYRELIQGRADMVQGVRSSIGRLRDNRYVLSRGLNAMLNLLFAMRATDNKSGFVMASTPTMRDVLQRRHRYGYFHTFIRVAAEAKGYTVREVETLFQSRNQGRSYMPDIPVAVICRTLLDLIKGFDEFRLRPELRDGLRPFLASHRPTRAAERYRGWRRLGLELFFLTMPLHKWLISRRARQMYLNLAESQWLAPADLRVLQEMRLNRLIQHVYLHVPYYREVMDRLNLKPGDITTLDDLAKLPLLSKDDVRENLYFDLFSATHRKRTMLRIATSGSTGEPFVTYADRSQLEMRWATTFRAMEWTGWRFGDRQARLWHQTLGMSWSQRMRERVDAWFMRRLFIPAYEIGADSVQELLARMAAHRPVLVDGYAESFNLLAQYTAHHGQGTLSPKAIMTSAQVMPAQVRDSIERSFRTKVFDKYGSREFSGIAYECEAHAGHHVMAESYIVEILKDGRPAAPGEVGEVVVTDLNNLSVPLIRYRIGDLATALDSGAPCPCGRGLPRIGEIEGRAQAIVVCADGTWLPGTFFAHFFKDYDYVVRQYQVVQERRGAMRLNIVKGPQFSERRFQEVLDELRGYVGREMEIAVAQVDEIPLGRTGKRTSVVSTLGLDFQSLGEGTQ